MIQGAQKEIKIKTNNNFCPYVNNPFSNCYCFNLNSRNISAAIRYCGRAYETCEIYIKEFNRVENGI